MVQDSRNIKIDLILDDLLSEIGFTTIPDFQDPSKLFGLSTKKEPVSIENIYSQVYDKYPGKYKLIFSIFHQNINYLFHFMNDKIDYNRHFNADQSRELIYIISKLDDLLFNLKNESIEITIIDSYKIIINECKKFLESSGGSRIPENFPKIDIIKYDPIFFINDNSEMMTRRQAASIKLEFDNRYMQQQIEQMLESIEKHPSDAIGKAKELIESCCKAILNKKENNIDLDSLDINDLIKKVKEELNLKSDIQSVKQIIGGLTGVATGIAQLRNAKGTGHGKDAVKFKEPSIIEARLSVDSAIALVHFFWNLNKETNTVV
jgi:hypothetical protein